MGKEPLEIFEVREYQQGTTKEILMLNMILAMAKMTGKKVYCNFSVTKPYSMFTEKDLPQEIERTKMTLLTKVWDWLVDKLVWNAVKKWCRTPQLFDTEPKG